MADDRKYLTVLQVLLVSCGVAWGVSIAGLVFPWSVVEKELVCLGANSPINDVMIRYWLKMAAAVYTLIGCFFIWVAFKPVKFKPVIPLIGLLQLILGILFLINGKILGVEAIPLYVDVSFCLCAGIGILGVNRLIAF